jgi:hypothetical protein
MDQTNVAASGSNINDLALRLPGGYRVKKFGEREFIVPEFLDLSTEQALAAIEHAEKNDMRKLDEVCDL